jgi:hypothetical protein
MVAEDTRELRVLTNVGLWAVRNAQAFKILLAVL